jgi:methylated-DNA-[protein]-cysteine S-methyltransferase
VKYVYHYDSPVGRIYIAESENAITDIVFRPVEGAATKETPLITRATRMLGEYFDGKRRDFDGLPLRAEGTEFQKKVWKALLVIPYGQTRTYKEQAEETGNAKACRAVGAANGRNPISIVIPCHRVIGSDGKMRGFAGGIPFKEYLLEVEGWGPKR